MKPLIELSSHSSSCNRCCHSIELWFFFEVCSAFSDKQFLWVTRSDWQSAPGQTGRRHQVRLVVGTRPDWQPAPGQTGRRMQYVLNLCARMSVWLFVHYHFDWPALWQEEWRKVLWWYVGFSCCRDDSWLCKHVRLTCVFNKPMMMMMILLLQYPTNGHIWCACCRCSSSILWSYFETKQDRTIVMMKHCYEVSITDSVVTFTWMSRCCSGEIFGFHVQTMCKYQYSLLFDLLSDHTCCTPSRQTLPHRRCCQQSVTLGICCSQSSSVVLMTAKSNGR